MHYIISYLDFSVVSVSLCNKAPTR